MIAASYDSSVLVYDCTGEALQSLLTRIAHSKRENIHCLSWKGGKGKEKDTNGVNEALITCSEHVVALWDLRDLQRMRPSLSFSGDGFVSVVSNENELAVLSSNGMVMVYDVRKNSAVNTSTHSHDSGCDSDSVHRFRAHEVGVGIERLDNHWLTWGIENDDATSVKVWTENVNVEAATENYWYMSGDVEKDADGNGNGNNAKKEDTSKDSHSCVAEVKVDRLTTVKVPSHPLQNGFVTISNPSEDVNGNQAGTSLWQADVWTTRTATTSTTASSDSKAQTTTSWEERKQQDNNVECLASFRSGGADDSLLSQMVGKDYGEGHLIAAELSYLPGISSMNQMEDKKTDDEAEGSEMLLCCLTSTGYITTHVIPEASELHYQNNALRENPAQQTSSPFRFHVGMHTNTDNAVKIYRNGGENDTAVNNSRVGGRTHGKSDADLYKGKNPTIADVSFMKGSIEGGSMQFDLDDEYEKDHDHAEVQVSNEEDLVKDLLEKNKSDAQIMEEIDPSKAVRVPCPRLCGATFGIGGGLTTFHNGNVKNMWNWYTSDYKAQSPSRIQQHKKIESAIVGGKLAFQNLEEEQINPSDGVDSVDIDSAFPRTVWDLMKMNEAAKVAQWGNERDDDDDAANSGQSSGGDSDDDDDGDSDDSSESGSEDSTGADLKTSAMAMYDNYFGGGSQKFEGRQSEAKELAGHNPRPRTESFLGPVTENLEPKVFWTSDFQGTVMNGQCPELAEQWILGPYKDDSRRLVKDSGGLNTESKEKEKADVDSKCHILIVCSSIHHSHMTQHFNVSIIAPQFVALKKAKSTLYPDHQRRETMVGNLQKLYYHDTKGSTASAVPLDQRVMQKGDTVRFQEQPESIYPRDIPRIETVPSSNSMRPDAFQRTSLRQRREICIHNANVATAIGQKGKADVWNILAEIVDSISSNAYDDFDGWHGLGGSALGRELLMNILRYYELNGDVQMLATIVSVLGAGNNAETLHGTDKKSSLTPYTTPFELLLPDGGGRYDLYIHFYGTLLYSWGKLTTRVELNKHLSTSTMRTKRNMVHHSSRNKEMFAPCCHRCNRLANPETNVCQHCQEYAFRCSICTNAVRGLFTVCISCGHGGHVNHIMPWFEEQSVCPTGCGCTCTLTTVTGDPA